MFTNIPPVGCVILSKVLSVSVFGNGWADRLASHHSGHRSFGIGRLSCEYRRPRLSGGSRADSAHVVSSAPTWSYDQSVAQGWIPVDLSDQV